MDDTFTPPRYPAVGFLTAHGMKLASLLTALPVLGGVVLSQQLGSWLWLPAGLVAGALLGLLMASYTEVLRIVADTLIPH